MKLSLAPIQGMTIAPYRNFYDKHFRGMDHYYAPFISPTGSQEMNKVFFEDVLQENNQVNLIPQLLGRNPDHFILYAEALKKLGYDEINWNIGCPFKNITRKKKGSGILAYPDLVESFIEKVTKDFKVSVKMRLGASDVKEGLEVIKRLNKFDLKEVIVHARTGHQMYTGHVKLDEFQLLHDLCQHDLAYNGDIFSIEDYQTIVKRFPKVNHVMLGRGGLRDPFLAARIKGIDLPVDKDSIIQDFHEAIFDHFFNNTNNDYHLLNKMKEFWTYTHVNLDKTGHHIRAIRTSQNKKDYLKAVDNLFKTCHWSSSTSSL